MTPVTFVLILLNVGAFAWLYLTGGWESNASLIAHGAIVPWYIRTYGQWWRIVTGAFLHAGIAHIGMNMIALAQLGSLLEDLAGSLPTLWIYFISMLGAGWAITRYSGAMDATVGASGAIYGLFGALIALGLRMGPAGRGLVASTFPSSSSTSL